MTIGALREGYAAGRKPTDVIAEVYDLIEGRPLRPVWISHARWKSDPLRPVPFHFTVYRSR
jgi:hypothetical protein